MRLTNRRFIILYTIAWISAVVLILVVWFSWPTWVTVSLGVVVAILAPDLDSIKSAFFPINRKVEHEDRKSQSDDEE